MTGLCAMTLPDLRIDPSSDSIGKFPNPDPPIRQFVNSSISKYNSGGQAPEAEPGTAERRGCIILAEIFEMAQLESRARASGDDPHRAPAHGQPNQVAARIDDVCLRLNVDRHQAIA